MDNAFQKFEIDKSFLAKVKSGDIDMIIDTEENKVFRRETHIIEDDEYNWIEDDEYNWFDMKPYDKRWD